MSNIKFSLGIYNKRFNCHGPENKNQKCPANPSLPKNSILMPNPPNISTKTRHAASIRIQSSGGGRMRLGGIKGGGIPQSTPATTTTHSGVGWVDRGQGPKSWGESSAHHAIASNATGDRLVALANNQATNTGMIIRSADYGVTWLENTTPPIADDVAWRAVASDSTGQYIVAVSFNSPATNSNIWLSSDYGDLFTIQNAFVPSGPEQFTSAASSNDGFKLAAGAKSGRIFMSTDSGNSWTQALTFPTNDLRCITSNADGTKLAAATGQAGGGDGHIWTSVNSGVNWISRVGSDIGAWQGIASNDDGTKLAAVKNGDIWRSTDSGATWTAMSTSATPPALGLNWSDIASNDDGTILVAVPNGANIWKSTDSGANWIEDTTVGAIKNWQSVASNSTGSNLAAGAYNKNIWTFPEIPAFSTTTPAFSCAPSPPYPMACIKPPRNTF